MDENEPWYGSVEIRSPSVFGKISCSNEMEWVVENDGGLVRWRWAPRLLNQGGSALREGDFYDGEDENFASLDVWISREGTSGHYGLEGRFSHVREHHHQGQIRVSCRHGRH